MHRMSAVLVLQLTLLWLMLLPPTPNTTISINNTRYEQVGFNLAKALVEELSKQQRK